jgi:lipid-binding SYLF domain-containing protein
MSFGRLLTATVLGAAIAAAPAYAQTDAPRPEAPRSDEVQRIHDSIEVLNELTATPDNNIPAYLLERAEAIVIIPSLVKGGFIVGAKHGKGVVSVRDRAKGTWSAPAFVNMTGGSIGWQIGAESVDLVLLVMNKEGVNQLFEDRFTLGGSVSLTAGPVGRSADANTNAQLNAQILAYSRAKGLFAGASLEGAALHEDDDANEDFYGEECDLREITSGAMMTKPMPQAAQTLTATLKRIAK